MLTLFPHLFIFLSAEESSGAPKGRHSDWAVAVREEEEEGECCITLTMGTYSSGGAGWILLDISITALTSPVTFSYTLSLERSRLAVGGGLIS